MTIENRPSGCFVVPAWWTKPAFTLTEVSQFLGQPISTVSHWLALAKAGGANVEGPFSCYQILPLVLLVYLRKAGCRINGDNIAAAFAFVGGASSRPIGHDELWAVFDGDGATVTVQAWLAWTAVRAFATKKFGTAHA